MTPHITMITHLKLFNNKKLASATLGNLGKVNVICGPNGSGKTTILEAASNSKTRSFGTTIGQNPMSIFSDSISEMNLSPHKHGLIVSLVDTIIRNQQIWFTDEIDEFRNGLFKEMAQNSIFSKTIFDKEEIVAALSRSIPVVESSVMLPAKRLMQPNISISTIEPMLPAGPGILRQLFFLKNQESNSEEARDYLRLQNAFVDVTGGYQFVLTLDGANNIILQFSRRGEVAVHAFASGLGLQDVLLILYYVIVSKHDFILIEEPESHLHPEMQRKLLAILAEQEGKQFLLSTHSNVFLDTGRVDRIFGCKFDEEVLVSDMTSKADMLNSLGYSINENLISDLLVLVEGPGDKRILEVFFRKMKLDKDYNIRIWPLGGDIMDQLDLEVFTASYKVIALIDMDPQSDRIRKRFVDICERLMIPVTRLERYSIENYFSLAAIREIYPHENIVLTALSPNAKLEEQLGFSVKKLGADIVSVMNLDELQDTDLGRFLEEVRRTLSRGHSSVSDGDGTNSQSKFSSRRPVV